MNSADGTIHFNSSFFCKNSVYLCVRLRERIAHPRLLKQPAVFNFKEGMKNCLLNEDSGLP